ncbi:conserved hypothetical protein, partial [Perkinsus marinus ATCC 50983]
MVSDTGLKITRRASTARMPSGGYLFAVVKDKVQEYITSDNGRYSRRIISLGKGDTPLPLPPVLADSMAEFSRNMQTPAGFVGYDSQYEPILRQLISDKYYGSRCRVGVHEIFCNDGSKPDIGRLQLLFDPSMRVAVQDPAYPVYADSAVLSGRVSGEMESQGHYKDIVYMPCTVENDFFPDLTLTLGADGHA